MGNGSVSFFENTLDSNPPVGPVSNDTVGKVEMGDFRSGSVSAGTDDFSFLVQAGTRRVVVGLSNSGAVPTVQWISDNNPSNPQNLTLLKNSLGSVPTRLYALASPTIGTGVLRVAGSDALCPICAINVLQCGLSNPTREIVGFSNPTITPTTHIEDDVLTRHRDLILIVHGCSGVISGVGGGEAVLVSHAAGSTRQILSFVIPTDGQVSFTAEQDSMTNLQHSLVAVSFQL